MEFPTLPEYEPDEALWQKIEDQLHWQQLPHYEPAERAWEKIELHLPRKNKPLRSWMSSLAAGLVLVTGLSFWLITPRNSVKVTSEPMEWAKVGESSLDQQQKRLELMCEMQVITCQQPEVREIRTELARLREASERLHQRTGVYHNDPQVIAWESQLDDQRAELLKRLAQLM
ncbi:hypothetical protein [Siphonobacter sp. SORGH_AS_1065]|uniref:hypothetical protein n=1 Tax=Siphonobacter sp. SORGH_AS_1065 TaxID=3041795 RepID=UPI00277D9B8C|nr:hypothetical protein [Siphonobacter sp. SORGH_AS_1065]MDQ1088264.1 hypothetical protein [Siphonobacter sp. SORGH_AS_1065]